MAQDNCAFASLSVLSAPRAMTRVPRNHFLAKCFLLRHWKIVRFVDSTVRDIGDFFILPAATPTAAATSIRAGDPMATSSPSTRSTRGRARSYVVDRASRNEDGDNGQARLQEVPLRWTGRYAVTS